MHISPAPVEPAAGLVHQTGRVEGAEGLGGFPRIELPPPLVERHPAPDAGVPTQRGYRVGQLPGVLLPAVGAAPAQKAPQQLPVRGAAHQGL